MITPTLLDLGELSFYLMGLSAEEFREASAGAERALQDEGFIAPDVVIDHCSLLILKGREADIRRPK